MKCLEIIPRSNLRSSLKRTTPDCVISINNFHFRPPFTLAFFKGERLVFNFDDVLDTTDSQGPKKEHIERLIEFGNVHKGKTFVVHCHAGVSRSSASAIILETVGGRAPEASMEDLTERFPRIFPNGLMIKLASEILQRPDLMKAYEEFSPIWRMNFDERYHL